MKRNRINSPVFNQQQGVALMVMLIVMVLGTSAYLVSSFSRTAMLVAQEQHNSEVLAQAREALISYATSVDLSGSKRPGDLPCPDTDDDGVKESSCGNASGTTGQASRIGRLPWKSLGLPELRDSSGEHLWYAVSNNFKENTRTSCTSSGLSTCLNSDSKGTITLRSTDGTVIHDGNSTTGVVAVIFAPGAVLTRQGSSSPQDRSSSGNNTASNYLDTITINGITEDNSNFTDSSSSNGFIRGRIEDADGNVIINDQLLEISHDSIMQPMEKRVAAEVKKCLVEYASEPDNKGLYPWPSRVRPTSSPSYGDRTDYVFGRVPDTDFNDTKDDSGGDMLDTWMGDCNINSSSGWWLNWKEMVFYGLANAYKPTDPPTTPSGNACDAAGQCLNLTTPTGTAKKKFVVIVAGKILTGQSRSNDTDKGTFSNYLESPNPTPTYVSGTIPTPTDFTQSQNTATFNDTVVSE
jgi:hypothetical protein